MADGSELIVLRSNVKRDPEAYMSEFRSQYEHFEAQLQVFLLQDSNSGSSSSSAAESAALLQQLQAAENDEDADSDGDAQMADDDETGDLSSSALRARNRSMRKFGESIDFLAHILPHYLTKKVSINGFDPLELLKRFVSKILNLIETRYDFLSAFLRKSIVQSLIMLRNRDSVQPMQTMPVFFKLFACPDKNVRQMIFSHIVNDIVRSTQKHAPHCTTVQNYVYSLVSSSSVKSNGESADTFTEIIARKALAIMVELHRRLVWNDAKTINVIASLCLSPDQNLAVGALTFLINAAEDLNAGEEMTEEEKRGKALSLQEDMNLQDGSKKTRKKVKDLKKTRSKLRKLFKADENANRGIDGNPFGPLEMIFDAQRFAEKLFSALKQSKNKFEVRLLFMNVISRLVCCHKLCLLHFYPFLQKYIRPHQKHVTQVIAYVIQATHAQVLPEVLEPIVRTLCNEFVTDRSGPETMAVGLNSVREICKRQPLVMDETLLSDLVQYKKHRDKSVVMAARSLIGLFREVNPNLLSKKDRGKEANEGLLEGSFVAREFGEASDDDVFEAEDFACQEALSDDDLNKLSTSKLRKKLKLDGDDDSDGEFDEESGTVIVNPESLQSSKRIKRREREAMLEEMKEKKIRGAKTPGGGTTNEEKLRKKPFQLTKYSHRVRSKILNSLGMKTKKKGDHAHTMKARDKKRRRTRRT